MDDASIELGVADYVANPEEPVAPRLKDSLFHGVQQNPDYEAEMRRASRLTGVDYLSAKGDEDHVKAQAAVQMLDPNGILRSAPKTANWLAEPDHAAIAHDDTTALQSIEQTVKNLGQLGKASFFGAVSGSAGYLQAMAPLLGDLGMDLGDEKSDMGHALTMIRQASKQISDKATPKTENVWQSGLNSGLVSLMQNAPVIAAAVLTKNPELAITGMAGLVGGQAYGDARDAGKSRAVATLYGGVQGGIEAGTEALPMHRLVADYVKHTGLLGTLAHQVMPEMVGEQLATLGQDFSEWAFLHPDKPFSSYLESRPAAALETAIATAVGLGGHVTLMKTAQAVTDHMDRSAQKAAEAQHATQTGEMLTGLTKAAQASALRERDPQTFQQYVEAVTQDSPVDRVYISATDLVNTLAQGSPEKLAENAQVLQAMPSVMPQLDEAVKSGGLVEIPLSELLAFTPDTSLGQAMMEHLKVDPEAMSMAEAQEFLQSHADSFKAEVAKAVESKGLADEFTTSAEAVRQHIQTQLDQVNRFTPDVNGAYASFVGSFYATQAARLGVTPEQLFAQHPLTIQAQGVTEGSLMNQEGPQYPLADRSEWHGEADYEARGGRLVSMPPQDYLDRVRPLAMDEVSRENIDDLKAHIQAGQTLDPLLIRADGKEDGRHRAHAAAELGIPAVPVVVYGNEDLPSTPGAPPTGELHQGTPAHYDYEPGLGFQSTLFNTVLGAKQAKASADQWLAMIQNTPGVKKEEVEWIGLPEALTVMGAQGSISREQILAYIAQNGVRVEEVMQDNQAPTQDEIRSRAVDLAMAQDEADQEGLTDEELEDWSSDNTWHDFAEAAEQELLEESGSGGSTSYDQYQAIPGGENYRELLLTMPTKRTGEPTFGPGPNPRLQRDFTARMGHWDHDNVLAHTRLADFTTLDGQRVLGVLEIQSDWHQQGRDKGYAVEASLEDQLAAQTARNQAEDARDTLGRTLLDQLEPLMRARVTEMQAQREANFQHTEALAREYEAFVNEHIAPGQTISVAGRWVGPPEAAERWAALNHNKEQGVKRGAQISDRINELKRRYDAVFSGPESYSAPANFENQLQRATGAMRAHELWQGSQLDTADLDGLTEDLSQAQLRVEEARQAVERAKGGQGIPDAPFKATWPALVMKRLIRMAVEQGYDHVAWSTGEQQADLYDMRNHIDHIVAMSATDTPDHPNADKIQVMFPGHYGLARQFVDNGVGILHESSGELLLTRDQAASALGVELGHRVYDQTMAARGEPDENGYFAPLSSTVQNFEGADLTVGGEGHKAFYNRNLVNITNDIVKKFGAKVAPVQIIADAKGADLPRWVENAQRTTDQAAADLNEFAAAFPEGLDGLLARKSELADRLARLTVGEIGPANADLPAHHRLVEETQAALAEVNNATSKWMLLDQALGIHDRNLADLKRRAEGQAQWGFPITEKMRTEDKAVQPPLFQNSDQPAQARGSFNPQTSTITLLRGADLSTFLHETGHFFLETLAKMAADEHAPQEIKDDWAKASQFIGFGGADPAAWLSIPVDGRREGHETFARGFEAYLREGRAPAPQLKAVFQRFKSWLLHVYQSLGQLNVELTPEVRGVFDRLLATSEDIARAEQGRNFAPVYDTRPEGMTDHEWEAYQRLGAEATADAEDQLAARSIRDMQWLQNTRARIIRQLSREAREKRQALRAEVAAEVVAEPVYAAQQFLKRGVLNGAAVEGPTKLSLEALRATYGEAPTALEEATGQKTLATDYRKLGYGKYGMLAEEGLDPDHVAELFGFSSGDELVKALLSAEPMRDKVEGVTDQRMLERYGDLTDPQAIAKAADEAIHNDARLRFVATEANAMAKAAGRPRVMAEAARDFARELVGRLTIRNLKPGKYTGAEARAATAAARAHAKGDLIEAATEKRNQLVNGYAAKAAYAAQQEVDKALRYFARLGSEAARKGMDAEYRDQIDQLLERFDLRKGESLRAIDKRKSLAKWIEAMRERGLEPVIDEDLANEAFRKHYKDLTVDELRGLVDAVKNIAHLGRLKNRLLVAARGRAFQAVVDEAEATLRDNAYQHNPVKRERNTVADAALKQINSIFVQHRKFASLIREMAGLKNDGGILWRAFIEPMNKANDREAAMREAATVRLAAIFKPIAGKKGALKAKLFVPELGTSLSLEGRLALALNWGNDLNRARILDGEKFTPDGVAAALQTLTAEQLGFVNQLWDYLDSYWPQIAAKERRVSGVAPEKVEAAPFQVRSVDGQLVDMRGGYYPIKYDTERSDRAASDDIAEGIKGALQGAYTRATTRRGHTKARVEKVERPVRFDLMVPFQHVNQVIHDLAFHEYLIDANRLISHPQISSAIRDGYGNEALATMRDTINAMAEGDVPAQNALDKIMNHIRSGTTIVGLGLNLMTGLLQPLGLTQSIVRIGPKYVAKGIAEWAGNAVKLESTVKAITEKSEFMRLRAKTMMREISEVQSTVKDSLKPAAWGPVEGTFFMLIQKLQLIADVPTWLGAYAQAQDQGHDDTTAIGLADQAVRDSQGSGQIGDLAQIQRGNVWMKLWTTFYSFFSVGYNQMAESLGETRRVGASRLPLLASDFLLVAVVPAILGELMKRAVRGDDWDWDELGPALVKTEISYLLGFMVGLRDIASVFQNDGKSPAGPASLRLFTQDAPKLYQQIEQGEFDDALRRTALNVGGILLHLPAGQVNRTIDGFEALARGETKNPLALAVGPPRKAH